MYEAGKVLAAYITPGYEEIARVSVCPYDLITGYTLFIQDEERRAKSLLTRTDLESNMVVHLAGEPGCDHSTSQHASRTPNRPLT